MIVSVEDKISGIKTRYYYNYNLKKRYTLSHYDNFYRLYLLKI